MERGWWVAAAGLLCHCDTVPLCGHIPLIEIVGKRLNSVAEDG